MVKKVILLGLLIASLKPPSTFFAATSLTICPAILPRFVSALSSRFGMPDRRRPQTLGVLAATGRGVAVVLNVERIGILGALVLLVLLVEHPQIVVLQHDLVDYAAAAHGDPGAG